MRPAKNILCVLLGLAFLGIPALSQEKLTLTLEESIGLALVQNPFHLATEKREDTSRISLDIP